MPQLPAAALPEDLLFSTSSWCLCVVSVGLCLFVCLCKAAQRVAENVR